MRVSIGVSSSQEPAAPGGYSFPDVAVFDDDWTTLSLPAGWTEGGVAGGYESDGTFPTATGVWTANRGTTSRSYTAITTIYGFWLRSPYDTDGYSEGFITDGSDSDGFTGVFESLTFYGDSLCNRDNFASWSPSGGLVVCATTLLADGTIRNYLLTAEGYVLLNETIDTPRSVKVMDQMNINITSSVEYDSLGVTNTYYGMDQELTISEIKTIATGWGWTETTFVPDSASSTTTDWSTGSAPSGWVIGPYSSTLTTTVSGSYGDNVQYEITDSPEYLDSITLIAGFDVTDSLPEHYISLISGNFTNFVLSHSSDDIDALVGFDQPGGDNGYFTPTTTSGKHFLALSINNDGTGVGYFYEDGVALPQSYSFVSEIAYFQVATRVSTEFYETISAGDVRLADTLIRKNEAMNQTDIETTISGWGWSP